MSQHLAFALAFTTLELISRVDFFLFCLNQAYIRCKLKQNYKKIRSTLQKMTEKGETIQDEFFK